MHVGKENEGKKCPRMKAFWCFISGVRVGSYGSGVVCLQLVGVENVSTRDQFKFFLLKWFLNWIKVKSGEIKEIFFLRKSQFLLADVEWIIEDFNEAKLPYDFVELINICNWWVDQCSPTCFIILTHIIHITALLYRAFL